MDVARLSDDVVMFRLFDDLACDELLRAGRESQRWIEFTGDAKAQKMGRPPRRALLFEHAPEPFATFDEPRRGTLKKLVLEQFSEHAPHVNEVRLYHYRKGCLFGMHPDAEPGTELARIRRFSLVCYLNDDLLGGHTLFPDASLAVQPKKGHAILFPSHVIHAASEVYAGEKHILVAWLGEIAGSAEAGAY